jgi:hypothetical protein
MSAIHDAIVNFTVSELQRELIDEIPEDDPTRVGIVKAGPLQGDPVDPDEARITVEVYENDPDTFVETTDKSWDDDIFESEVGGITHHKRRFTVKATCIFELTREDLAAARSAAATVRERIEDTLLSMPIAGLASDEGEFVSLGLYPDPSDFYGKMKQEGGPPDSYGYLIKIRFTIITTKRRGA